GLSASVLDDHRHIFHVGSLSPRAGTGGDAIYIIGQSTDDPSWFRVGYVNSHYWTTAIGVSLFRDGDIVFVSNSYDSGMNGFGSSYHIIRYAPDGTARWSLERPGGHP